MKTSYKITTFLISLVVLISTLLGSGINANAAESGRTAQNYKILMFGNSYTFYNNSPMMLRNMIVQSEQGKSQGLTTNNVTVNYVTWSSQSLYNHAAWIETVIEYKGNYTNFKNHCSESRKQDLAKNANGTLVISNDDYFKKVFGTYAAVLYKDYDVTKNRNCEQAIKYDFIILQEYSGYLPQSEKGLKNSAKKNGEYSQNWIGGASRLAKKLQTNNTKDTTVWVINATTPRFGVARKGDEEKEQKFYETQLKENDNRIKNYINVQARNIKASFENELGIDKDKVRIAYTGQAVCKWLLNHSEFEKSDTTGKYLTGKWAYYYAVQTKNKSMNSVGSLNALITYDRKHPTQLGSMLYAACLYSAMFNKPVYSENYIDSIYMGSVGNYDTTINLGNKKTGYYAVVDHEVMSKSTATNQYYRNSNGSYVKKDSDNIRDVVMSLYRYGYTYGKN